MKTIKILSLLIVSALALSSCKNNMSLTKRHYTKGYYFHKSKSIDQPEVKEGVAVTPKKHQSPQPIDAINIKPTEVKNTAEIQKNQVSVQKETLTSSTSKKTIRHHKKQTSNPNNLSLQSKKEELKQQSASKQSSNKGGGSNSDVKLILCIILAIIIPPLGMYVWNKKTDTWFIVDLILFLLWASWFWIGSFGLVGLTSVVIALLRVLDII